MVRQTLGSWPWYTKQVHHGAFSTSSIAQGKPVMGVIVASSLTDQLKLAVAEVGDTVFAVEYELQVRLQRHP